MRWLFPTPLYEAQLNPSDECHQAMLRLVKRFHRNFSRQIKKTLSPSSNLTGDAMSGTKADQIHHLKDFDWLNRQVSIHVSEYLAEVCGKNHPVVEAYVQKSWPVVCEADGGMIHPHTHPNAHISAVYYLDIDPLSEAGKIRFMPSDSYFVRSLPFPSSTNSLIQVYSIKPRVGQLLIFPANLLHSVDENTSALPRYSIAYDILLTTMQDDSREMILSHPASWRLLE